MLTIFSLLLTVVFLTACESGLQVPEQTPSPETVVDIPTTKAVTTTATAVDVSTQSATDAPNQSATAT